MHTSMCTDIVILYVDQCCTYMLLLLFIIDKQCIGLSNCHAPQEKFATYVAPHYLYYIYNIQKLFEQLEYILKLSIDRNLQRMMLL